MLARRNIIKNIVIRRIIEIRIHKRKPKLNDILKLMKQRDLTNPKARDEFKKRFLALYDDDRKQ